MSFSYRAKNTSSYESKKIYPLRYPSNNDSVGIEVVGSFIPSTKDYETPTQLQFYKTKYLVHLLLNHYNLKLLTDVYSHGTIARKQPSEGTQLLKYIFNGAQ